jgi:hypothetical protein
MKNMIASFVAALALIVGANAAQAGVTNVRPVTGDLSALEAALDSMANDGNYDVDVINDQMNQAIWEPTGGAVATTYVATVTWGFAGSTSVGLYSYGDPSKKVDILNPVSNYGAGSQVIIQFIGNSVRTIDLDTLAIIDQEANFGSQFGLYMTTTTPAGAVTWYTEDSLNGGNAQILAYEATGEAVTIGGTSFNSDLFHHYFAFEGLANDGQIPFGSGNIDFDDLILQLESIRPVPAPAALALAALGMPMIGWVRRRLS